MNKLLLSAALALALTPSLAGDAVAAKSFQFMFINHTNMQLHFSVDNIYACTANAGMVCYSRVAVGPHTFQAAMGNQPPFKRPAARCTRTPRVRRGPSATAAAEPASSRERRAA